MYFTFYIRHFGKCILLHIFATLVNVFYFLYSPLWKMYFTLYIRHFGKCTLPYIFAIYDVFLT